MGYKVKIDRPITGRVSYLPGLVPFRRFLIGVTAVYYRALYILIRCGNHKPVTILGKVSAVKAGLITGVKGASDIQTIALIADRTIGIYIIGPVRRVGAVLNAIFLQS